MEEEIAAAARRAALVRSILVTGTLALGWALLLAVSDGWLGARPVSAHAPVATQLKFALLGLGVTLAATWPLALLRAASLLWASAWHARHIALAALEGTIVALVVSYVQHYTVVSVPKRWGIAAAIVLSRLLVTLVARRFRFVPAITTPLLVAAVLGLQQWLSVRQYPWVHVALALSAGLALIRLLSPWLARARPAALALPSLVALGLLVSAPLQVRSSMALRGLLYDGSVHARAHAALLGRFLHTPPKQPRFGEVVCASGTKPRCAGSEKPRPSTLTGSARGADVLMLSIDALRWDHAYMFAKLRNELGPRVTFRHAVSPAPHTAYSFAASLRGRPLRQVPPRPARQQHAPPPAS